MEVLPRKRALPMGHPLCLLGDTPAHTEVSDAAETPSHVGRKAVQGPLCSRVGLGLQRLHPWTCSPVASCP